MDFDRIFDDLEGRLVHLEGEELRATSEELARAERAQVTLEDRFRAAVGTDLTLRLTEGTDVVGTLAESGPEWLWLELRESAGRALVPVAAVDLVIGLTLRARPAPPSRRRPPSLASRLRELARDREVLRIETSSGAVRGRIETVGQDAVDVIGRPADDGPGSGRGTHLSIPLRSLQLVLVL